MKPSQLERGYWVYNKTTDSFVKCYNTIEQAQNHIDFQKSPNGFGQNNEYGIIHITGYEFVK